MLLLIEVLLLLAHSNVIQSRFDYIIESVRFLPAGVDKYFQSVLLGEF
jgi:hypothetical protein